MDLGISISLWTRFVVETSSAVARVSIYRTVKKASHTEGREKFGGWSSSLGAEYVKEVLWIGKSP